MMNIIESGRTYATRLVLALLCGSALLAAGCKTETTPPNPQISGVSSNNNAPVPMPAVKSIALPDSVLSSPIKMVDGQTRKLSDYKGKVVLVNYWATWCGPCRQEMPELVAMRQALKDKGFEVISVTHVVNDPDPETVKAFVQQFKLNYPVGYAESGLIMGLQTNNQQNSIPQSFIISREGRLLKRFVGYSPAYPAAMRAVVEEALNEKAAG